MAEFDNAELLQDIRDRGGLPSGDLRFADARLLQAATLELRDAIAPLLVETQTERAVTLADMAVTAGVAEYRLPSRALGMRFKSVGWKSTGDNRYTRLAHRSADSYYLQSTTEQGTPSGFFVRDNVVVLVPTPNAAGTLRVPYYARPATLAATSDAGVIASTGASTVTLTGSVAGFTSGAAYDIVRSAPGFEVLVSRVTATLVGTTLTFSTPLPVAASIAPAVGDYVALAGFSPVAQCPVEVRGLLAVRAARRALKSVNEGQQASMLDADVDELTIIARGLLAPRADAEPQEWGDVTRGLLFGVV